MKSRKASWKGALLIVSVFLGIIGYGLIYGLLNLNTASLEGKNVAATAEAPTAPTVAEYRLAAGEAMGPFFRLAFKAAEAETIVPDEALLMAARATQAEMLKLRVPKEEKDAHMEAVLLLEQWIRAMGGSRADARQVAGNTFRMVEKRPWLFR